MTDDTDATYDDIPDPLTTLLRQLGVWPDRRNHP
jgi:hypothetical protein